MYTRILFFLLCLTTIAMVESQDIISTRQVANQSKSVVIKCAYLLVRRNLSETAQRYLLPLSTMCHPNTQKYLDCIVPELYKSNSIIDIGLRSRVDLSKRKDAGRSLCREAPKLNEETFNCNVSAVKCLQNRRSTFQPLDSPLFCRTIEDKRCAFINFAKCDLQRTMLWAKFHKESESIGCLLADPKFQLVPSYGPETKCYSFIDDIKYTDYSQIYERYCKQFNYTEVSGCVEETVSNVTSEELWEDKESYLNKARKFVNDRRTLCRHMTTLSSLKCSNPTHKPDVSKCQKMLFLPPGPTNYQISHYLQFYGYCIWLTYLPCNFNFGFLIYRNIITY